VRVTAPVKALLRAGHKILPVNLDAVLWAVELAARWGKFRRAVQALGSLDACAFALEVS